MSNQYIKIKKILLLLHKHYIFNDKITILQNKLIKNKIDITNYHISLLTEDERLMYFLNLMFFYIYIFPTKF